MRGAVIVMTPLEGAVEGSFEGSRGDRLAVHDQLGEELCDRATPPCGTQLRQPCTLRREPRLMGATLGC